jgi:D-cysteine desulfhydrase family pyridoxal phosphate-dependent enzyme
MLSRLPLAHLPTPIDFLPHLSRKLGGPRVLIKRDDQTGLAFGGNKTRKLEYLLAEAKKNEADTLITTGAAQSNHCRQTAAAAARKGFRCRLVLVGPEPEETTGNYLLDKLVGAEVVWTRPEDRDRTLQAAFEDIQNAGHRPYLIPYGGSNQIGAGAYAVAIHELQAQIPDSEIDWIVFASSSGGTQAGMVAGAKLFDLQAHILGISVDESGSVLSERVAALASDVTELFGERQDIPLREIRVNDDYLGGGYGVMGEPEREAIQLFARSEGILLDPVYTGRAAAGLLDLIRTGTFRTEETVLFWHTGGTPGLFAERYQADLLEN